MKHIPALDSLRYLMAVLIVVHHIFVNFYMAEGRLGVLLGTYLAVDGFFVISGVLLMNSYVHLVRRQADLPPLEGLRLFTVSRLRRLYPEFLFVLVLTAAVRLLLRQSAPWSFLLPDLFMLGNFCGVESMVRDAWFISSLFWMSLLLFALTLFFRKPFCVVAVPAIMLLCYLFILNVPRSLSLNSAPMFFGMISGSVPRTLFGLCAGMITFMLMPALDRLSNAAAALGEAACLCYAVWLVAFGSPEQRCDFVPVFCVIIAVLCRRREWFLRFLSWKGFDRVNASSYMLFLCHLLIVENAAVFFRSELMRWNPVFVFLLLILLSLMAALVLSRLCRMTGAALVRLRPLLLR